MAGQLWILRHSLPSTSHLLRSLVAGFAIPVAIVAFKSTSLCKRIVGFCSFACSVFMFEVSAFVHNVESSRVISQ